MDSALQSPERRSISVVTPVYNGEASIAELCRRLGEVLPRVATQYEIILVNDDSRDRSWEIISELCSRSSTVRGLNLMRNYGQHNALLCGIRAAQYDVIVTMDDDLQHPPEEIPRLLARLDEGFDVVYGTPKAEQNGFLRAVASRITRLALSTAVGSDVGKNVSAFRPRHAGPSNYTFAKLVRHALDVMTGFSTLPLQLASMVGFACTLFGMGVLIYVIGSYLFQGSIPGFPFVASLIAIFSGAQLFALGVIGEYLARIHFRMMNRPLYVVRGVSGEGSDNP